LRDKCQRARLVVVDLIAAKKLAGRAVSWVPGTGKALRDCHYGKELGPAVPFCPVAASTVYSKKCKRRKFSWNTFDERLIADREDKEVYEEK
jgi:RuvB-like protein 1 (pontin 52)